MLFGKNANRFYVKYAHWFILGVVALLIVDYFQLIIPDITGGIIDGLDDGTLTTAILRSEVTKVALIAILMVVGRFLWRYTIFGASRRIDFDLRNEMFAHGEKLSAEYYSNQKIGGLMAYFTNDLEAVRMAFGPGFLMAVDAAFLGTLAFIKMVRLDLRLALLSALPLLVIAMMGGVIGKIMQERFRQRQHAFEKMSDFTQENFSGIAVIKAFVKEVKEIKAFSKINEENYEKNIHFVKAAVVLQIVIISVITMVIIIILGYGGYLVYSTRGMEHAFTVGDLARFIAFFSALIWPMMAIAQLINLTSQARASMKRIGDFLDQKVDIVDAEDAVDHEVKGKITFNNLTFHYPGAEEEVLKNVSFNIEVGETVGIIGRTGSGKTSLIDVLLRLYNIEPGRVFLDNIDLMKLKIRTIRDAIAYVPQDNFLFSDTLTNNIAFSLKEVDKDQVVASAKIASIHEDIVDFKEGYETIIGERGVTLSGGQKQRTAMARALLKDAPILILDDSVSAVDTATEESILRHLKETRKGKTTLLIAHRISTIKQMDKIILVDDGHILAVGKHEDLIETSELYKDMVLRQQLEEEIEGA